MERTLGHYVNKKILWNKYMNGFSGKPFMAGSWEGEKRNKLGRFLAFSNGFKWLSWIEICQMNLKWENEILIVRKEY